MLRHKNSGRYINMCSVYQLPLLSFVLLQFSSPLSSPHVSNRSDAVGELTFPSCCFDGDLFLSRCWWEFFFSLVFQNSARMGLSLSLVIDFVWNPLRSSESANSIYFKDIF